MSVVCNACMHSWCMGCEGPCHPHLTCEQYQAHVRMVFLEYLSLQYSNNPIQYNTLQYNTIQYNTLQYSLPEHSWMHAWLTIVNMNWLKSD